MTELRKIIGGRIRALRTAAKMSKSELSRRIGCHHTYICHLEEGRATPSVETLMAIGEVFGVSAASLLEGDEAPFDVEPGLLSQLRQLGIEAQFRLAGLLRSGVIVPLVVFALASGLGTLADTSAVSLHNDTCLIFVGMIAWFFAIVTGSSVTRGRMFRVVAWLSTGDTGICGAKR